VANRSHLAVALTWGLGLFTPGRVAAFDSFGVHPGHVVITVEAASFMDIPAPLAGKLCTANTNTDLVQYFNADCAHYPCPNSRYNPASHFDRLEIAYSRKIETTKEAFRRGCDFVRLRRGESIKALNGGDYDEAITRLGQGLHSIQDLVAHSSLVDDVDYHDHQKDLYWMVVQASEQPNYDPPILARLTLCGSDPETGKDAPNYGHGPNSKDSENTDQGKLKLADGTTKYKAAVNIATWLSIWFLEDVRKNAPAEWDQLIQLFR
jgi:hypothetical protein